MAKSKQKNEIVGEPIPYDPTFNGPLKHRSCTDVICLLLFFVFVGCWIGIGVFAFVNGNPDNLLRPRDSEGARCGIDSHVANKPFLFFFDLTRCLSPTVPFTGCPTQQVCVSQCPQSFFLMKNGVPVDGSQYSQAICVGGRVPSSQAEAWNLIQEGICAQWHLPSAPLLKRCLYKITDRRVFHFESVARVPGDEIALVRRNLDNARTWISLFVQYFIGFFSDSYEAQKIGHDIVEDLQNSWKEILVGFVISILFCIIYISIMRWIAGVMVWLSIIGAVAGLAFCVYWSASQYIYYRDHPYEHERASTGFQAFFQKEGTWLGILIAFSVILLILLLVILFLRNRICLAIALIKEGSKAVSAVTSALFFPIVPWLLQLGVIVYVVALAIYVSTVGNSLFEIRDFNPALCQCSGNASHYQDGVECDINTFENYCGNQVGQICNAACRYISMSNANYVPYMHAINVVGFFWGLFFVSALSEMILAGTFATWYWTYYKSNIPFFTVTAAALRTVRYHLGTLAFGSLIITICRLIRVMLEYIDHQLKKYENPVTKAIMCCLKCFFWCLENFLKWINRNAYIMCAIHGKNFCVSAKDAFSLLMRNIIRVFVLDKVTDFLFFLSKILVVIGVSSIIYSLVAYVRTEPLTYNYVPVIFVAICTYFVASVFFSVYTMAIDTLFLCFLEDCERNDGSPEKPYFMSKNLMKILNKKNK